MRRITTAVAFLWIAGMSATACGDDTSPARGPELDAGKDTGDAFDSGAVTEDSGPAPDAAPTVLVSSDGAKTISVDGSNLYFVSAKAKTSIGRVPTAGGAVTTIVSKVDGLDREVQADDGFAYFADLVNGPTNGFQVERANGTQRNVVAAGGDAFAPKGGNFYTGVACITSPLCPTKSGFGIVRVPSDGTPSGTFLTPTSSGLTRIRVDGTYVLWVENESISVLPLAGGASRNVAFASVSSLSLNGGYAYWTETALPSRLLRARLDTASVPEVIAAESAEFTRVIADGSDVYWIASVTGVATIRHLTIGSAANDVVHRSDKEPINDVALDATHIFFATSTAIYSLPR